MVRKRTKTETIKTDIAGATDSAFSDIEELAEEMEEWRSNMEDKLSHTDKYSQVEEAASTLEGVSRIEIDDEDLAKIEVTFTIETKRSMPRWLRLANAVAALQGCVDTLDALIDNINDDDPADDDETDRCQDMIDLKDELENAISEVEGVEFPGMYG